MTKRLTKQERRKDLERARVLVDQGREIEARELFQRHGISYVPSYHTEGN